MLTENLPDDRRLSGRGRDRSVSPSLVAHATSIKNSFQNVCDCVMAVASSDESRISRC